MSDDQDRAPEGFGPGVLTTDSGEQWLIGDQIGAWPAEPGECDAASPSQYQMADGSIRCRCIVCSRCGHHTGNSNQGHYWAMCHALAARVRAGMAPGESLSFAEFSKRTTREFHFCCDDPAFGCELEAGDGTDGAESHQEAPSDPPQVSPDGGSRPGPPEGRAEGTP